MKIQDEEIDSECGRINKLGCSQPFYSQPIQLIITPICCIFSKMILLSDNFHNVFTFTDRQASGKY